MKILNKDFPHLDFQSSNLSEDLLEYSPFETIHVHHNGKGHFCTSSSIGGSVHVYDSLNQELTAPLVRQLSTLYSPDPGLPSIFIVPMQSTQTGGVDCGLYALAYAVELAHGGNPSKYMYDQAKFRRHLLQCLHDNKAVPFPKVGEHPDYSVPYEYTEEVPETEKWVIPKGYLPRILLEDCSQSVPQQNRFAALSPDFVREASPSRSPSASDSISISPSRRKPKYHNSGNVVNLSSRQLSQNELSLLNLGLPFSTSCKSINKEQVCTDTFNFIRRLKLREYFGSNAPLPNESEEDRDPTNWVSSNPDWYPAEVQNGSSAGLQHFIDRTVEDMRHRLLDNDEKFWNNLTTEQRRALTALKRDESIVIKPSDKSGGIVVMDRADYEKKCLEHLSDQSFYEAIESDPNPGYRQSLNEIIDQLKTEGLLSDMEFNNMKKGDRTPCFYGLPKTHKEYDDFPELRPICSGSDGVTVRASEFVDSYLKPAARKTASYIRDTTEFVRKIAQIKLPSSPSPTFLVTMDVKSLYTNIEHTEGIAACSQLLDERQNQRFPTSKLCDLIQFILQSNTMKFTDRFFHQVQGTAMGTPMAVNYANIFMSSFETRMLREFAAKYGTQPFVWLRYIDDVFFIWNGSEELLKTFIDFANNFAVQNGYKSKIEFTSLYSNKSVSFLDTVIRIENGHLVTDLYQKPSSSHDYLHRSSYHPQHLLSALPKSQFMRIRRICTHLKDYKRHAQLYVSFFKKRGYREADLQRMAANIENYSQEFLLSPRQSPETTANRVPFVLTHHHKLLGLGGILRKNHLNMLRDNPSLKDVFPEAPIVAHRRQRNLKDNLVRADHCPKPKTKRPVRDTKSDIQHLMNTSGVLVNDQTNKSYRIEGGSASDKNVIYAVKCKCHKLVYVGFTSRPLNERMNGHRSDINCGYHSCELVEHFIKHKCDFKSGIEISILAHVNGSIERLSFEEDKWITKVEAKHPTGMNERLSGYAKLYYKLFG